MMHNLRRNNPDIVTSGSWGGRAYCLAAWFQYQWPPGLKDQHITVKELLPIVFATAVWGAEWANKSILCRCDNEAVVHIINSGTSKDPLVMGLMRCLHFITAKLNSLLSTNHIAGIENSLADALYWCIPDQTGCHLLGAACSTVSSVGSLQEHNAVLYH